MRKVVIVLTLLLLPSALFAQVSLKVSQVDGKVEWRAASSNSFVTLVNQPVQSGDEIRTGPGANLILMVPDGSYMVVHENSRLVVEDFWSGNFKSMVNLMLGQVRFYIQRIGGRPNPYSVRTPTALIAVRGTTFDVMVDDSQFAEVRCIDGRVTVENVAMGEREVILEPGFKTLVRPGEYPMMPVRIEDQLNRNRLIAVRKVNSPDSNDNGMPSVDRMQNDNDRRNRPLDPVSSPSRTNENTQRAKPGTLSFP